MAKNSQKQKNILSKKYTIAKNIQASIDEADNALDRVIKTFDGIAKDSWNVSKQRIKMLDKINDAKLDITKALIVVLIPGIMAIIADNNWSNSRVIAMLLAVAVLFFSAVTFFNLILKKEKIANDLIRTEIDRIKAIQEESTHAFNKIKTVIDKNKAVVGVLRDLE